VPEHKPHTVTTYTEVVENPAGPTPGALSCASGYCKVKVRTYIEPSRTLYDALRITTWALLIVGLLLAAVGLVRYVRVGSNTPG
jgi:hypothetical protein